ncbi:wall-associated receptor kinase-like 20 [Telopea speciosissima]|uniref:wall-associated receptor kinase-like 20 n=1 Tax=Telopea speciosissima TaxID=54955 RepID=UPI001CC50FF7|nr:wall-associated receptor kinase-like 20 [Telopea speciosissima]
MRPTLFSFHKYLFALCFSPCTIICPLFPHRLLMMKGRPNSISLLCVCLSLLLFLSRFSFSQRTCPNCGSMEVPYPLSTNPSCGNPDYRLRCDGATHKLYFDTLNGSSYLVLSIQATLHHMVVQPSPWVSGTCITEDMVMSQGLRLNQTLPFNVTSSNTIFLFNCSPRLLLSPLNCTSSSLCHHYLENSGGIDPRRALQCTSGLEPCCTFVAGGMPSAYKIRLHRSGCQAFRSILNLDPSKPANQWVEGLEIQWVPPLEPVCRTQLDCSKGSTCSSTAKTGIFRCLCNRGYHWDHTRGTCSRKAERSILSLSLKVAVGVFFFLALATAMIIIMVSKSGRLSKRSKLEKEMEDILKASNGGKPTRLFSLKELKKATAGFSKDRLLGSGGFGEVYKGELQDGTSVAIKAAKVGNIKSTQQVLNEVGILSQVNHKNLVRLLGVCVEAEQPLMIYDYVSNGTLHGHLQGKDGTFLDWKRRLQIALQTAEALTYLHSSAYTPIYHRDIKSTNILLDGEFNAKVADFGLSRLAKPGLSHVSTCAQGTLGYLDPEYYRNYRLTEKSDVYSYGVVLLELLTSQNAIDFSRDQDDVNLAIYVTDRANHGAVMEIVDRRFLGDEPSAEMMMSIKLFSDLALACLREKKVERPNMKDVVQELQCIIGMLDQKEVSTDVGLGVI